MLQSMRKFAHTPVVKALMLLLVVSFALWGIGDMFRGNPLERTVAKVGSKSISVQALTKEFDQQLAEARQMFGGDLTSQQAKQMGLLDKTLDIMIQRSEVDQDLDKLGINVSQKAVLDQIAAQPQFRDKDGKFNKALFQQLLQQAHLNERGFIDQGRQDLARRQLIDVFSQEEKVPQSVIDALYQSRGQKRVLDVVTLNNDSITDITIPEDKILQVYYQQNPKPFTAPEYRNITIARLSTDDLAKEIAISDDDLKKEYDTHRDQWNQPEQRDLLQVVVQDEDKAKKISSAARANGNFTNTAKELGYEAIPLNQTEEKSLFPELAKPVFAMQEGQISDPIKTSLGWHVIQLKKIRPAGIPEFNDLKDSLRETIQKDQAVESMSRMVNQLDDDLAAGHGLEDIADSLKMRLIKIPSVDASGKLSDGKEPAELPNKVEILKTAFAENSGEVSPILDDKKGNYFVVRTDEITPSALKPFDQVKDEVAKAWKADQQAERAAAEAEKIAQGLRDGKPASDFAKNGVEARVSKPVSLLGDSDPALPPSVLTKVYKLKKGDAVAISLPDKQIILRLAELQPANAESPEAKVKINDEIKKNMPNELTQEYLKYLRQVFPDDIHQDTLETIRQQGS